MKAFLLIILVISGFAVKAQHPKLKTHPSDSNLIFSGTRVIERDDHYDSTGHFILSGYISCYYAGYSDTAGPEGYQKFPTVSPIKESFSLNMAIIALKYKSERFRGVSSFHFGDIPSSAWSKEFNYIQEANLGFRLVRDLWLDAGFFRTHIGLESIQPRENMTMSIAVPTYFEPYYLSGAKLSYTGFEKLIFQVNAFNSFNGYVENNHNKAYGLSFVYDQSSRLSFTLNAITCDESQNGDGHHQRLYNNFYSAYKTDIFNMGIEVNYGIQKNSGLEDSTKTATMFSGLIAFKYRIRRDFALYTRLGYFSDPDEMLTGPVEDSRHQLVGLDLAEGTLGFEFKPIPNSYLRLECRMIQSVNDNEIFYQFRGKGDKRYEIITGLGLWF